MTVVILGSLRIRVGRRWVNHPPVTMCNLPAPKRSILLEGVKMIPFAFLQWFSRHRSSFANCVFVGVYSKGFKTLSLEMNPFGIEAHG